MNIEEVIKEVKNIEKFNYTLAPKEVFDKIYLALECYQSIEEPKTGHWICPATSDDIVNKDFFSECSECGRVFLDETDYCPNCGAKMEEE